MKKLIVIILLIFSINAFSSYESIKINKNINLIYQSTDENYDYTAIIIDRGYEHGYINVSNYINEIVESVLNAGYFSFTYQIAPEYSIIEFYTDSRNCNNILLSLRKYSPSFEKYNQDYFPSVQDELLILRAGFKNNKKKFFESISLSPLYNNKMLVFAKTKSSVKDLIDVLKSFPEKNTRRISKNSLFEGNVCAFDRNYYFIDYKMDEYYMPEIILLYNILKNKQNAVLRFYDNKALIILDKPLLEVNENEFHLSIQKTLNEMKSSYGDIKYLNKNYAYIPANDYLKSMTGIMRKLENLNYRDFTSFFKGLKVKCSFKPVKEEFKSDRYSKISLKNGITLIHTLSDESFTEISVMFDNIISMENYYGKAFSAEYFFNEINKLTGWKNLPVNFLTDYKIYTYKMHDVDFGGKYNDFVSIVKEIDVKKIIDERLLDSLIHVSNNFYADRKPFIETYFNKRINPDKSSIMLTNSEMQILHRKIFDNSNIVVSIKTSLPVDSVVNILENSSFFDTGVFKVFDEASYLTDDPFILRMQGIDDKNIIHNAVRSFINSYDTAINKKYILFPAKRKTLENLIQDRNMFNYNIAENNGETVLVLLSEIIHRDYTVLLKDLFYR